MCLMALATRKEKGEEKEREGEEEERMLEEDTVGIIIKGIRNLAIMGHTDPRVEVATMLQEPKGAQVTITRVNLGDIKAKATKARYSSNSRTAIRIRVARGDRKHT